MTFRRGRAAVLCGDARHLPLPDASIAAIVCDPPYDLPGGFMGKAWDRSGVAFDPATWREAHRVLAPGGHLIAFGGTRTWHRMVCAVEDAGFEIRDTLQWLNGSGFPKSRDVSKAIDNAGGASPRDQARVLRVARERAGLTREQVAEAVGCTPSSVRDWEDGRARAVGRAVEHIVPCAQYRTKVADLLGYTADERVVVGVAQDRRGDGSVIGLGHSGVTYGAAATPEAAAWVGWGTALKPGHEPIVLARKPLAGTVAANVLAHGTGGINVGGCRIGAYGGCRRGPQDVLDRGPANVVFGAGLDLGNAAPRIDGLGRWPTNVLLSHAPLLDDDGQADGDACADGCVPGCPVAELDAQNSDAPRFYPTFRYEAKAPGSERPTVDGVAHPTVKPVPLMAWLVRLITPPGGAVLDMFAGTGPTGEAASREGFDVVLVEKEPVHLPLIRRRFDQAQVRNLRPVKPPVKVAAGQVGLFGEDA